MVCSQYYFYICSDDQWCPVRDDNDQEHKLSKVCITFLYTAYKLCTIAVHVRIQRASCIRSTTMECGYRYTVTGSYTSYHTSFELICSKHYSEFYMYTVHIAVQLLSSYARITNHTYIQNAYLLVQLVTYVHTFSSSLWMQLLTSIAISSRIAKAEYYAYIFK